VVGNTGNQPGKGHSILRASLPDFDQKEKLTEREFRIFESNDMGIGGVLVKKSELTLGGGANAILPRI